MDVQRGDAVVVKAYGEMELERRVIGIQAPFVMLTTDEELDAAKLESRPPMCIGFPLRDIVRIIK